MFDPAVSPDGRFTLGDIQFQMDLSASQERRKSDAECFTIVKSKPYLDCYASLASTIRPRTILELGIFQGGGYAFLDQLFRPERMAALDLSPTPIDALSAYIAKREGRSARYGVSQTDGAALEAIFDQDLGGVLDMVVDDASHTYAHTRRSFELLFPRLSPGGVYIIEDWAWAHHPRYQGEQAPWHAQPAMTNLVFELVLLLGSMNQVSELRVHRPMVIVFKSPTAPARKASDPAAIWDTIVNRGKSLVLV